MHQHERAATPTGLPHYFRQESKHDTNTYDMLQMCIVICTAATAIFVTRSLVAAVQNTSTHPYRVVNVRHMFRFLDENSVAAGSEWQPASYNMGYSASNGMWFASKQLFRAFLAIALSIRFRGADWGVLAICLTCRTGRHCTAAEAA